LDANRRLTANVSHELRTPLATLRAYFEVLEAEHGDKLPAHDMAVIRSEVQRLTQLIDDLWSGSIVARLLQPAGLVGQLVARMLGGWVRELSLFSVPLLLAAPLLGVNPLPAGGPAALLFGASLALGVAVGVALDFVMAALMVAWGWNRWDVDRLRAAVGAVLSGALLPLSLLPWGLGDVLTWLPFASQAWVPLSIYTGSGEVLSLLGRQLLWVAVMWPLARWLWRVNRQKVVIYGG
jgi:ABC-2 type transport system permease protein